MRNCTQFLSWALEPYTLLGFLLYRPPLLSNIPAHPLVSVDGETPVRVRSQPRRPDFYGGKMPEARVVSDVSAHKELMTFGVVVTPSLRRP